MNVEETIKRISNLDRNITTLLINGGCYQFSKYLKSCYPSGLIMINKQRSHTVFEFEGSLYDIRGLILDDEGVYSELTEQVINEINCEAWDCTKNLELQRVVSLATSTSEQSPKSIHLWVRYLFNFTLLVISLTMLLTVMFISFTYTIALLKNAGLELSDEQIYQAIFIGIHVVAMVFGISKSIKFVKRCVIGLAYDGDLNRFTGL